MKKIVILFMCIFIFNTANAAGYNAADIEKQVNISLRSCSGENPVTEYDYSKLSDEEKLNNALLYYFKLMDISLSVDYEGTPQCAAYFSSFQNYLMESIESIKDKNIKNSKKYYYANIIYHLSKNGLYEYDKIMELIKQLGNISLKEINSFYKEKLDKNSYKLLENSYNVINFLKNNTDIKGDLQAALFYEKIIENKLTGQLLFEAGKFDIFNSFTDIFSAIDVQGSGRYVSLLTYLKDIDNNILTKFVKTFSKTNAAYKVNADSTYIDMLEYSVVKSVDGQDKFYIFPFKERVYVIKTIPLSPKLYDMFLFTLDNLGENYDDHIFIANIEGRRKESQKISSINSLKAADLKEISKEEVFKNTENSPFIKDKKALLSKETDYEAYNKALVEYYASFTDYIYNFFSSMPGMAYLVPSKFYKVDIDNDGKDELLAEIHLESTTIGESGTYTIVLNEKTLQLEATGFNAFLITFMGMENRIVEKEFIDKFPAVKIDTKLTNNDIGTGFVRHFYQKIYTENGKNKIALIDDNAYGIYIDILNEKDKLKVSADTVYEYKSNPQIVWKGKIENGRAEDLINTNASFDMSKASTLSEKAIVNDVNLRMLDRLSSDKYFKSVKNAGSEEKNRLLNERRQMNKKIKNCNGDNKCIYDILYADVFK